MIFLSTVPTTSACLISPRNFQKKDAKLRTEQPQRSGLFSSLSNAGAIDLVLLGAKHSARLLARILSLEPLFFFEAGAITGVKTNAEKVGI